MAIALAEHVRGLGGIKLYGVPIHDFPAAALVPSEKATNKGTALAQIRAYSIGSFCSPLPTPILLVVFGDGTDVDDSDSCGRKGEKVWLLSHASETLAVEFRKGSVLQLLEEIGTRGIDGGISIENPRVENGRVCATIHVWAKIEIFGAKVSVNERIPICIPLEGCFSIFEFGFGNVQACVRAAPPSGVNLCIKLCVGKWGLDKCWDACTYVSLPAIPAGASATGCNCA